MRNFFLFTMLLYSLIHKLLNDLDKKNLLRINLKLNLWPFAITTQHHPLWHRTSPSNTHTKNRTKLPAKFELNTDRSTQSPDSLNTRAAEPRYKVIIMILIADNIHKGCLFSIERLFRRGEIRLDLSRNTAVAMGTRPFPLAEKFLSALWRANSGLMQISYIVHVICVFALIIFIWMTGTSIYSSLQNDGLFLVVGADSSGWRFRCRFGDKWVKISSYLIFFIIMYYFSFIRLNFLLSFQFYYGLWYFEIISYTIFVASLPCLNMKNVK